MLFVKIKLVTYSVYFDAKNFVEKVRVMFWVGSGNHARMIQ